jgi:soluble lytic murein transglycosylase-like protein
MRFEPAFEARYVKPAIAAMPTTEEMAKAVSFGLMQIMGETAREFGFKGRFLTELCDPETGLEYGCRKLRRCFDNAAWDAGAALLHWNGGSDPTYPLRVVARVRKYEA